MPSPRERLLALILLLVGVVAWWVGSEEETAFEIKEGGARRPDYTVDGLTATMMDETGRPHRRLTAPQLRHYPDDESTELERPVLTVFKKETPPWVIRSETGWISADGDEIILQGEVLIDREAGGSTRPVHIKTRELHVHADEEYAETDQLVEITSNADWVTSMGGAQVWFRDQSHINFIGRVHALLDIDRP